MARKYDLTVNFCFDRNWLKGFCYATKYTRTEVIKEMKESLAVNCADVTTCSFRVSLAQGTNPNNGQWTVWVSHDNPDAPNGCKVRRVQQVATSTMKNAMERLSNNG